jgi:hypothetical protein
MLLMQELAMTSETEPYGLDRPLVYHIRIQGVLDPSWSDRLEGLQIEVQCCAGRPPTTLLSGCLRDQAALNGVLSALYGLGCTLLSVSAD